MSHCPKLPPTNARDKRLSVAVRPRAPANMSSVNLGSLGEGLIKDVAMTDKLKGLRLRILPGYEIWLMSPTPAAVEVTMGMLCAVVLKGRWTKSAEASDGEGS